MKIVKIMKKLVMPLLVLALLCGACLAETEYDLSTARLVVFQTSNGIYRTLDFEGHFVGEDSETFPTDRIEGDTAVYMEHGEFGYVASDGTVLVEAQFVDVPVFSGDYAVVSAYNYDTTGDLDLFSGTIGSSFPRCYGVIDNRGNFVVPLKYGFAQITEEDDYAIIGVGNTTTNGLINLATGEMCIEPKYWDLCDLHDGALIAIDATINPDAENTSGDEYAYRYGILSINGDVLLPIEHDCITYMPAVHAFIVTDGDDEVAYRMVDGKLEIME